MERRELKGRDICKKTYYDGDRACAVGWIQKFYPSYKISPVRDFCERRLGITNLCAWNDKWYRPRFVIAQTLNRLLAEYEASKIPGSNFGSEPVGKW